MDVLRRFRYKKTYSYTEKKSQIEYSNTREFYNYYLLDLKQSTANNTAINLNNIVIHLFFVDN